LDLGGEGTDDEGVVVAEGGCPDCLAEQWAGETTADRELSVDEDS
jgi:hypothetical protein